MTFKEIRDIYWKYYISLENQFLETGRYVELDYVNNGKTYSMEYLKLFQAVCSEIDVMGKTLAAVLNESWTCRDRHKGRRGNGCMCRTIRETDLITAICVQMDWEKFDEERFEKEVERVVVTDEEVVIAKRLTKFTA